MSNQGSDEPRQAEVETSGRSRSNRESGKVLFCSFCGKSQHEVRKLIAGPNVFICNECLILCVDICIEDDVEGFYDLVKKSIEENIARSADRTNKMEIEFPDTGIELNQTDVTSVELEVVELSDELKYLSELADNIVRSCQTRRENGQITKAPNQHGSTIGPFDRMRHKIYLAEQAFRENDLHSALIMASGTRFEIESLIGNSIDQSCNELLGRITDEDYLGDDSLRELAENLRRSIGESASVSGKAQALTELQNRFFHLLLSLPRAVLKVNVFPHGMRQVFAIEPETTLADIQSFLLKENEELILTYLSNATGGTDVSASEVTIDFFTEGKPDVWSISTRAMSIPNIESEGLIWYPKK